jgi:tetraacyldisaccharide 4'-kinase
MNLPVALRILLWPFSLLYGGYVAARTWLYDAGRLRQRRLRGKVISVGNLTVGGTGKTPMVIWLAEKLLQEGKRVAILSRGYRGTGGTSDEIELMKQRLGQGVAFGVGRDRFAEGRRIEQQSPVDVFLLDDGFQHRQLARDVDILMLDGSRRLKNEWLLPAGSLREPVGACRRADILVVTRKAERPEIEAGDSHTFSIFYAQTRLLGFRQPRETTGLRYASQLGPGPFFAFCGIGNPQAFFDDLAHWQVPLAGKRAFRDHHRYSTRDVQMLQEDALRAGAIALMTTEKDACNIESAGEARLPIYAAAIDLVLSSESEFHTALERKLATGSGVSA